MGRQGGQLPTQVLTEELTLYQPEGPDCAPHNKVGNILKGSLDLIPSPSPFVKIQIIGEKVCLRCKGKTKSLLTSPSNVLPYYLK